ncbi:MAG: hypothetical protein ABSE69_05025 [Roseiarcus sp.]
MLDEKMPARVRVDAAKTVLDRSGFSPRAIAPPDSSDDLPTYSRAELMAIVAAGESKMAIEGATDAEVDAAFDIEALLS